MTGNPTSLTKGVNLTGSYAQEMMKVMDYYDQTDPGHRGLPCADKLSYATEALARAAASYAVWQYGERPTKLKAYKCRYCHDWHLASDIPE